MMASVTRLYSLQQDTGSRARAVCSVFKFVFYARELTQNTNFETKTPAALEFVFHTTDVARNKKFNTKRQ